MSLFAVALLVIACGQADRLVGPAAERPGSPTARGLAVAVDGCARIRLHVQGRDSITADVTAEVEGQCDSLRVVIPARPTFDRVTQQIMLPLALENTSHRRIKAPAWLAINADSITILFPTGLARNQDRQYVDLPGADSVGPAGGALAGASLWTYDTLLAAPGVPQVLSPGDTSNSRAIRILLKQGVQTLDLPVQAHGRYVMAEVPAVAPDTVPQGIEAPERLNAGHQFPRDIILVRFKEGTTVDQKQAAVDLINGQVIGGVRYVPEGVEGLYVVRIQDDGTTAPLHRAIDALEALPQVDAATVDFKIKPSYLRPTDGVNWTKTDWSLRPEIAAGINWAPEEINAPYAWGCSTGSKSVPITVIDHGFNGMPEDLLQNVHGRSVLFAVPGDTATHGEAVASIIGAAGNNGDGMTGVMWNADLRLYDTGAPGDATFGVMWTRALNVALYGARGVVNLSFELPWDHEPSSTSLDDVRYRDGPHKQFKDIVHFAGGTPQFLLVVPAGNSPRDASWAGLPLIKLDFPDNVIVVGGAEPVSGPSSIPVDTSGRVHVFGAYGNSGTGPLVDVAAPADLVVGYHHGVPVPDWGTSFAAPLVAGTAGLILSFDPVTPEEARRYIIEGARRGGRVTGSSTGVPLIDAYESLRMAPNALVPRYAGT